MKPTLNPFSPDFKLIVCDGPRLPEGMLPPTSNYIPCDFNALMLQTQHLLDAMFVLGLMAAVISITYAGALLIVSGPEKRNRAKDIFSKVGIGFAVMLTSWFIVHQLLTWLVRDDTGIRALIGS